MNNESPTVEIKRRVAAGLLPRAKRFRAFAGRSYGATCDACGRPIPRSAIQYEVDLVDDSELVSSTIMMHASCHVLWLELSRVWASTADEANLGRLT